jgi:hypothetical protein
MNWLKLSALLLILYAPLSWSQCAPGIPGAGNPGCIPPTAPGSPYGQPDQPGPLPPAAPAAVWEDRWGAIAMDFENGAAGGTVNGTTKKDATQIATQRCVDSGGAHCSIVVAFVNQCAAVAQKPEGGVISSGTAAEAPEASERAINRCGDSHTCKVLYSLCSYAVRVR